HSYSDAPLCRNCILRLLARGRASRRQMWAKGSRKPAASSRGVKPGVARPDSAIPRHRNTIRPAEQTPSFDVAPSATVDVNLSPGRAADPGNMASETDLHPRTLCLYQTFVN